MIAPRWRHLGKWASRGGWIILALALTFCIPCFAGEKKWNPEGYWLPEGVSTYSQEIDNLFYGVLYLTGAIFVVTEALLLYCLIAFRHRDGRKSHYTHGNHTLELVWTISPALILGIIAILQKSTWEKIKMEVPETDSVKVHLFAQQFEWNFRYAGNDGKWGTKDDVMLVNQLYVPVNKNIVIEQSSKDVIHSFFLPYMRLKQDVVPGMHIKVWFNPTKTTDQMRQTRPDYDKPDGTKAKWNYEIACAELCGSEHSQMRGELYVLEQKDFDAFMTKRSEESARGEWDKPPIWKLWKVGPDGKPLVPEIKKPETSDASTEKHG